MPGEGRTRFRMWDLMLVGQTVRRLQELPAFPQTADVHAYLRDLLELLESLQLPRSDQMAHDRFNERLLEKLAEEYERDSPLVLDAATTDQLRQDAFELEATIRDEASQRTVFVVPYERDGNAEGLLRNPSAAFGVDSTHQPLSLEFAVADLEEFAECYAIGRPAAAILFAFRATEAFLRQLFEESTRHLEASAGSTPKRDPRWRTIVNALERGMLAGDMELLKLLHELCDRRNAAMHCGPRNPGEWGGRAAMALKDQCNIAISGMQGHMTNGPEAPACS